LSDFYLLKTKKTLKECFKNAKNAFLIFLNKKFVNGYYNYRHKYHLHCSGVPEDVAMIHWHLLFSGWSRYTGQCAEFSSTSTDIKTFLRFLFTARFHAFYFTTFFILKTLEKRHTHIMKQQIKMAFYSVT